MLQRSFFECPWTMRKERLAQVTSCSAELSMSEAGVFVGLSRESARAQCYGTTLALRVAILAAFLALLIAQAC